MRLLIIALSFLLPAFAQDAAPRKPITSVCIMKLGQPPMGDCDAKSLSFQPISNKPYDLGPSLKLAAPPYITVQHATRADCDLFFKTVHSEGPAGMPPIAWGGCTQNVIVIASGVTGATGYELTIQYTDVHGVAGSRTAYVPVNELGQGVKMFEDVDDITLTRVIATAQRADVAASMEFR